MSNRTLSVILFTIGVIVGIVLAAVMAAADFEASLFDQNLRELANRNETNITCPIIVTRYDTGRVQTRINNPPDHDRNILVRAHISSAFVTFIREDEQRFDMNAGESKTMSWLVTTEDAAWDRIILARVYVGRGFGDFPPRTASCGILSLDIPFPNGATIVGLMLAVALGGMIGGLLMWRNIQPHTDAIQSAGNLMLLLAGVTIVALVLAFLGYFVVTGILLFVALLMLVGTFGAANQPIRA